MGKAVRVTEKGVALGASGGVLLINSPEASLEYLH